MIELTTQQIQAWEDPHAGPAQILNPRTHEVFVLLRVDEFKRLNEDYDDSPWTRQELESAAWHTGKSAGWDEMNEYEDLPEKP